MTDTTEDLWGTASAPLIRKTLRKRAEKRAIEYLGGAGDRHQFRVIGDSKLGDTYGEYIVRGAGVDPSNYSCSCQSHGGGQYRRVCSHLVRAVIMWEEEGDELEAMEEDEDGTGRENEPYEDDELGEEPELDISTMADPLTTPVEIHSYQPHAALLAADPLTPEIINQATPQQPPLPTEFDSFRSTEDGVPIQAIAIQECIEAFDSGKKVVFLSAPTGTGKTLIGESVGRVFGQRVYTCTTKSLQEQAVRDFDYAKVLKGRSNYQTLDDSEVSCDSCTVGHSESACWDCGGSGKGHCSYCHPVNRCPYRAAREDAATSWLSVLNTAYLLASTTNPQSPFRNKPFYIIDEADELESQLMGFVQVEVSPAMRRRLKVGLPDVKGKEESWVAWVKDELLPAAKSRKNSLGGTLGSMKPDPKTVREINTLESFIQKLGYLVAPLTDENGDELPPRLASGWVMDVQGQQTRWKKGGGDQNQDVTLVFKPIVVSELAHDALWNKGQRFLLMSATFVGVEGMAKDLGLERDDWALVEVESTFAPTRRPAIVNGVASVTSKTGEDAMREVAVEIGNIMERHPDQRILVHTVSYRFTKFLSNNLPDRRRLHWYYNSWERETKLEKFLDDPRGVMLASSFERGIDLRGDQCRVVVIAKVPYPFLGDEQVKARLHRTGSAGRRWYSANTIRTIVQMTGRGMRSEDDWCISYILDSQFKRLYAENRSMWPSWWVDGLVWDKHDPQWRQALDDIFQGRL